MATWPTAPREGAQFGRSPDDDRMVSEPELAREVIGDMAVLLRETRADLLAAARILVAITLGVAAEAAFSSRMLRPGADLIAYVFLLTCLFVCWLRTVALLALADRPLLGVLSDHRWKAGSPLDPRPRWLTLPALNSSTEEWCWARAHLLLAAARMCRQRTQLALTWGLITTACFLILTAAVLLGL